MEALPTSPPGDAADVSRTDLRRRHVRDKELQREQTEGYVDRLLRPLAALGWQARGPLTLDVGAGGGRITESLRNRGYEPVGIELDHDAIALAREIHPEHRFVHGSAERLPFPDETFELVILAELLEHVRDWRRALREAGRVLTVGGAIVISTSNRLCPIQHEISGAVGWPWLPGPVQRRLLARFARQGGERISFSPYPAIHWFTPRTLKGELRALGIPSPLTWPDLATPTVASRPERAAARASIALRKFRAQGLMHLAIPSLSLFGVKERPG